MSEHPWPIFRGNGQPHDGIENLPPPPPWRNHATLPADHQERPLAAEPRGANFQIEPEEVDLVNASLFLRRPLLVTGKPGIGKSSLAYAIAHELQLGPVLVWPIITRSRIQDGLYRYDAIARAQSRDDPSDVGEYIQLGPLGTALVPARKPRVLLIDEIDKCDIDFPNELLHVFEEGFFEIPELSRLQLPTASVRPHESNDKITINKGRVRCAAFPIVVMTSNNERDFPPPFLRRCIRMHMQEPDPGKLERIVAAHFDEGTGKGAKTLISEFVRLRGSAELATDQLLNAVYLVIRHKVSLDDRERLKDALMHELQ